LYRYLFPDEMDRERLTRWDMEKTIAYGARFGEVRATANLCGFSAYLPPGETDFTEERMAEVGMLDEGTVIGSEAETRLMRFVRESEHFHKLATPGPHWYLLLLCVDPALQGTGTGSRLLADLFSRADEVGLPIYLETLSAKNVPYYQKRGFDVRSEGYLSDGGVYVWYMVRDPVTR